MIQQQSYLDIADNTGAKEAMCIKVLRGSSSKGKFKRKVAHVGDVIICAVKKTLPGGEVKQGSIIRCVVVRTRHPTRRVDGSYVRFDHNAAVTIDKENNRVVVEGINRVWKHVRPNQRNQQGGRIQKDAPVHLSNVLPYDPASGKGTRVRFQSKDGLKHRIAARGGTDLGKLGKA